MYVRSGTWSVDCTPWTQGVTWMNVTRSEDVQDVFWTCYTRSIYVLCPGGNKYFVCVKFPCDHSWEIILGCRVALACIVIVPAFLVLRKWLLKFLITNCFMFLENNTYLTERLFIWKSSQRPTSCLKSQKLLWSEVALQRCS